MRADMRFPSVAERELRAQARHKAAHRVRCVTAAAFFGLFVWMIWVFGGFRSNVAGPRDVITGKPMALSARKRRMRGLGPNGTNDEKNKVRSDDWLWSYPVPTNAAPETVKGGATR